MQKSGDLPLTEAFDKIGVSTNLTYFRSVFMLMKDLEQKMKKKILLRVCEDDRGVCSLDPLSSKEHITKSLASRWSIRCLNIRIGENDYSILASRKDTYFIAVRAEETVLTSEKYLIKKKS